MNKSDKLILELYRAELPPLNTLAAHNAIADCMDNILQRGKELHERQLAMERASIKCDEQE